MFLPRTRSILATSLILVILLSACQQDDRARNDSPPDSSSIAASNSAAVERSSVAIAVISLDPEGWNDLRSFLNDLPQPTEVKIFYGSGNTLRGTSTTALHLLDSLNATRSLRPSDKPATLPYFSKAIIAAIGSSLETTADHARTVVLGTFPPLLLKTRADFERIGPIITRTELESLAQLPDHRFIIIGPAGESILRDMLLRALSETRSNVTSISYQSGVQP